ncbi:MAG TPA: SLC13 family permease [Terriglobia bacterium]|nr:SLC13 family permease [Terriglobia bacterium]
MKSGVAEPATTTQVAGLIAAPLVVLALWFAPTHIDPAAQHAIAISALMIILWATEAMDYALAGFIGVFLFWALGVSRFEDAFSGFSNETPWFLLGAILIGAMAGKSGLARRIAYTLATRIGTSYSRLLLAFIIVDCLLTFLIPSGIARVTILATIAAGTVNALGLAPRSNVGRGLLIIVTYTAAIFDKMLIAGAASILARGIIEQAGNVRVLYSQWFIAYLPCDLITIFCCWRLILWLYPPEKQRLEGGGTEYLKTELELLGPWSVAEKKCAALMAVAVLLWMTEFMHPLSPSMVGLTVGLLALAPAVGVLDAGDLRKLNFGVIWFTAAALSMGRVLAETKGLDVLTTTMLGWMKPLVSGSFTSSLVLYWTAFIYHFFLASETDMLSTSLPAVLQFFDPQGLHPLPIGMIWTFASGGKIFVYQSAVLVVGYSYGYFEARDLLRVGLILTVVESLILLVLVPLYWPLIGIY